MLMHLLNLQKQYLQDREKQMTYPLIPAPEIVPAAHRPHLSHQLEGS